MNEPHDLDVPTWANTVQLTVTAIRNAGASSQMILMPGTNFASAGQFVSSGSADALLGVKNPDGTTTGLVYDLHKYLDVDNSGTHSTCTTDNIEDAFVIAAEYLRSNGRQALVSETGAGSDSSVSCHPSCSSIRPLIWVCIVLHGFLRPKCIPESKLRCIPWVHRLGGWVFLKFLSAQLDAYEIER